MEVCSSDHCVMTQVSTQSPRHFCLPHNQTDIVFLRCHPCEPTQMLSPGLILCMICVRWVVVIKPYFFPVRKQFITSLSWALSPDRWFSDAALNQGPIFHHCPMYPCWTRSTQCYFLRIPAGVTHSGVKKCLSGVLLLLKFFIYQMLFIIYEISY